jgi:hypothetical protein
MKKLKNILILSIGIFLFLILDLMLVSASASFQVISFSCSPSEVAINSLFSCTAQVKNVGDNSGVVSIVTLYPDASNWLENSNYPQAYGSSISAGQTVEVTFSGLKGKKSGNNGFSKIMLDSVTDTYVSDDSIRVNVINVAVTLSNSFSSLAMGQTFDSTVEVTSGGNINVVLGISLDSGGCGIGSQSSTKTISGMQEGNKQSRVWTITQGSSGDCIFTISAIATGIGGLASKTDSLTSTVDCSNCPTESEDDSLTGSSGGGGGGSLANVSSLGNLISEFSKELASGGKIKFNVSNKEHILTVISLSATTAVISIQSKTQIITLLFGEEKQVDLDEDGKMDISILLKSINTLTKKAVFVLKNLQPVTSQTESSKSDPGLEKNLETNKEKQNLGESSKETSLNSFSSGNFLLFMIILIIILIIIGIIVFLKIRRKNNRR